MMKTSKISNDHLIRALRLYVSVLTDPDSPSDKGPEYLRDLAGWIACAASRIEELSESSGKMEND